MKLTLDNAPIGTKAPAINGGHWVKTNRGWKWCTGATFPTPGGDWTGELLAPDQSPPVQEPVVCLIGMKGSAYDTPTTKRAYTYKEQPGNTVAWKLGKAFTAAQRLSAGDYIDSGLGLIKELEIEGFGVFDLGAEYTAPPTPPDVVEVKAEVSRLREMFIDAIDMIILQRMDDDELVAYLQAALAKYEATK